jgi:pantetheine-phosphate adenylyltransferase
MKKAIYPGSFDPITNGHIDIIKRALTIFDHVVVLVANNPEKKITFTTNDRVELIKGAIKQFGSQVSVDQTDGLSVRYAKAIGAIAIVRGLRAVPDFEYEYQIAAGNEFIDQSIEMVFLMGRNRSSFISSSTIKQLNTQNIDISPLVPNNVYQFLKKNK